MFENKLLSNSSNNALFGYTGFVGSTLQTFYKFDYLYNSKNIENAKNKTFNTIIISCIPATKWYSNKYPEEDISTINYIKEIFKTIKANNVILISTIDIYHNTEIELNEKSDIDYEKNHTYGKNRFLFEDFIKTNFVKPYIIRLPALFGNNLKKNIIYDLLNNNNINNININSYYQWYNLEWLKEDLSICINNNLYCCNLFTEPIDTNCIIKLCNTDTDCYYKGPSIIYNSKTLYDKYFPNGNNGYIRDSKQVFESISKFIFSYHKNYNFNLCVSNLSSNSISNEQYYSILKYHGIKNIEIAPTKYGEWIDIFREGLNYEKIIINKFNLNLYSFQSITYNITNNIFDDNNEIIMNHIKNVIDVAYNNNVKILVFGSPKNRYISNYDKEYNDTIFISFMNKIGDYIDNRDITICIENNSSKYNCNYLNTIDEVGYIVKKINNKNIKMIVDIGNCIMENDDINNINKYSDYIYHIHVSNPYLKPFINYNKSIYKNLVDILKNINYKNKITLEFLNEGINEIEILNDSIKNFIELFN